MFEEPQIPNPGDWNSKDKKGIDINSLKFSLSKPIAQNKKDVSV
jgi:hypothetical protein